jgi:uncharacterized lipoprotein YbaY
MKMRSIAPILVLLLLTCAAPAAAQPAAPASGDAGYYFLLGRRHESMGDVDKAVAAYKQALALAPNSAELRAELAGLYARQDRGVEAIDTAEEALTSATYEIVQTGGQLVIRDPSGSEILVYNAAVTGVVTYPPQTALPDDAVVIVQLRDVSLQDVPAEILGQDEIQTGGLQGLQSLRGGPYSTSFAGRCGDTPAV